MRQALEERQIALLDGIRKASGRKPFERKPAKFRKVVGTIPPTPPPVHNQAAKRASGSTDETPKRKVLRKEEKAEINTDDVSNAGKNVKDVGKANGAPKLEKLYQIDVELDVGVESDVQERNEVKDKEVKKKEAISGSRDVKTDSKLQVKRVPAAIKDEITKNQRKTNVETGSEKNKRRARTKNNKWCPFGCSALLYDFETGVALPDHLIEENMEKMRKSSSREWSYESWLEKASIFHDSNPDMEQLCVANALMTIKFNELVSKKVNGLEKHSKYKTAVMFDLSSAKMMDTRIILPSARGLKITDLFDNEFLRQLLHSDVDKMARKMTLKVLDWISKDDSYCVAYTVAINKPTSYVSLGNVIPERIAKLIAIGLKWNEEKVDMETGRIVMISRGIMENFLSKHRGRFNARTHPGASLLVARDLKGELKGYETDGSIDEEEEDEEEEEKTEEQEQTEERDEETNDVEEDIDE